MKINKRILCLVLTGLICVGGINFKSYANENTEKSSISFKQSKTQNGWVNQIRIWYYYQNGIIQKGWKQISGKWYYLKSDGAMAIGWTKVGGQWYYLKSDGAMATGWLNLNGTWYYLENNGSMATGWKKLGNQWYFLKSDGAMQKGWQQIQGTWYYLYGNGVMATNTTIDGWKINASGVATPENNQRDEYTVAIFNKEFDIVGTYISSMNKMLKQGWSYAVSYARNVDSTLVDVYNLHLSINSNSDLYNAMTSVLYNMSMYNKSVANNDLNSASIWLNKLSNSWDKVGTLMPKNSRDIKSIHLNENLLNSNVDSNQNIDMSIINNEVHKLLLKQISN